MTTALPIDLLLAAYRQGLFPMADGEDERIGWYSPSLRGILPLDDSFNCPRTVRQAVRRDTFSLRTDTAFEVVIRACAAPRGGGLAPTDDDGTWIDERIIAGYVGLHEAGHAHTVEAWRGGRLVGGLYGVHIGGAFFGESMFVRPEGGGGGALKVCLVRLVALLRDRGFTLLDTQYHNEHLSQFGCLEIPRDAYLERLRSALEIDAGWPEAGPLPAWRP